MAFTIMISKKCCKPSLHFSVFIFLKHRSVSYSNELYNHLAIEQPVYSTCMNALHMWSHFIGKVNSYILKNGHIEKNPYIWILVKFLDSAYLRHRCNHHVNNEWIMKPIWSFFLAKLNEDSDIFLHLKHRMDGYVFIQLTSLFHFVARIDHSVFSI